MTTATLEIREANDVHPGTIPKVVANQFLKGKADGSGAEWAPSPAGVTDHGALTGLADDDHSQYAQVHGNRVAEHITVTISADQTDWTPSGWGNSIRTLKILTNNSTVRTVNDLPEPTGLASSRRVTVMCDPSSPGGIILAAESGSTTNPLARFTQRIYLQPGQAIVLERGGFSGQRWVPVGFPVPTGVQVEGTNASFFVRGWSGSAYNRLVLGFETIAAEQYVYLGGSSVHYTIITASTFIDLGAPTIALNGIVALSNRNITGVKLIGYNGAIAHGAMGATETIDFTLGGFHTGTLDANVTLTITAPGMITSTELKLTQDATGGRTITWPASVKNAAAINAALTTTASTYSRISLGWDETGNCVGVVSATGVTP